MRPTPDSIKSEIIKKFLEGYSNTEIHKQLDVSVGTISAITNEECRKNEYYRYIHEIAKKFRILLLLLFFLFSKSYII